ncbi:hypothetical protein DFH06DRAFT_1331974 [Mycena polygramma]|nr:hypothetical protein DFH06DRAFT_1331974 [Mycena polygramma]
MVLANLPQNVADTFLGAVSNVALEHKRERDANRAHIQSLDEKLNLMSSLLQQTMGGKNSRARGQIVLPPPPAPAFIPPPSIDHAAYQFSPQTLPLPLSSYLPSSAFFPPSGLPRIEPGLTDNIFHFPSPFCPSPPASDPSHCSSIPLLEAKTIVGGAEFTGVQLENWATFASKFDDARLRRHDWDWVVEKKTQYYLPIYAQQDVDTITELWTEWSSGLDGYLAV